MAAALKLRPVALGEVERARQAAAAGDAGKPAEPLDFGVTLPDPSGDLSTLDPIDLADLLGVSLARVDRAATSVTVEDRRSQPQCERSWKRDGTVRPRADGGLLSDRDAQAVGTT